MRAVRGAATPSRTRSAHMGVRAWPRGGGVTRSSGVAGRERPRPPRRSPREPCQGRRQPREALHRSSWSKRLLRAHGARREPAPARPTRRCPRGGAARSQGWGASRGALARQWTHANPSGAVPHSCQVRCRVGGTRLMVLRRRSPPTLRLACAWHPWSKGRHRQARCLASATAEA